MKTQRLYSYLTLAALISIWGCTSSRQTAQNAGDADDLYGNYSSSSVYAKNQQADGYSGQPYSRSQRYNNQQQRSLRNANPDYNDDQQGYNTNANTDDYYTELSARNLKRGLSPDPGWSDDGTNAYNSGFVNGYNAASTSAYSWNRWGFNNTGFYSGLGMGMGMGMGGFGYGYPGFSFGFGSPFYSPFGYGSAFAYSPFYSPFGYGGYGGYGYYDPFYSPFYSPFGYGGYGYGGFYGGSVAYINNNYITGADPYRSGRTYGPTGGASGRFNDAFVNTPRAVNNGGRASAYNSAGTSGNSGSNNGYYATPRSNSRGSYYYDNGSNAGGRAASTNTAGNSINSVPSYNSNSGNGYYTSPRQSSRGSYTPSNGGGYTNNGGGVRGGYSQPSYSQPSYQSQSQNRSFSQPSFSSPTPSFGGHSSGSSSGGGGGFSGGGGHVGGGGRGPR